MDKLLSFLSPKRGCYSQLTVVRTSTTVCGVTIGKSMHSRYLFRFSRTNYTMVKCKQAL